MIIIDTVLIPGMRSDPLAFFVKYTLIQFRFRMAKMYLCPLWTPINEEIRGGFGVKGGGEIRQGDLRVLLLLYQMFMERMMQEK